MDAARAHRVWNAAQRSTAQCHRKCSWQLHICSGGRRSSSCRQSISCDHLCSHGHLGLQRGYCICNHCCESGHSYCYLGSTSRYYLWHRTRQYAIERNANVPGSFVYSPSSGTVLPVGTPSLSVTFTPTDSTDYKSVTASVTLNVDQATPTITWAAPAAITYGTALGSTQLNASANVPGSFVYTPSSGTVLPVGTPSLSVMFTPTDSTDYKSVTASVSLNVDQATPTITWAAPAAITYGTALGSTQLNASANVPGSFVYTPSSGTVLAAGTQLLSVTFTPYDLTDYKSVTVTVNLNVGQATPTITWSAPAAITYGTALGSTQLNASANVLGSFVYTPNIGTVLAAGTAQSLSVVFTPSDPNYLPASASVQINVNGGTLYVVANDKTRAYSDQNPVFDATYLGFVNGDTPSSFAGTLTCNSAATSSSGPGSYAISCSGLTSTNYSLNYANGQLTITNPLQSISVSPATPTIQVGDMLLLTATGSFEQGARTLGSGIGMWAGGSQAPFSLTGTAGAELNGRVYVVGGSAMDGTIVSTVEVYDPVANAWSSAANMPTARAYARAAVIGGLLYVVGGSTATGPVGALEVYDPGTGNWSSLGAMPTARFDAAVGVINDKLYVAGGATSAGAVGVLEVYDPVAGTWSAKASLNSARSGAAAGVINGLFYVAGGSSTTALASTEVYDPSMDFWNVVASMESAQASGASAVVNGTLYIISGMDGSSNPTSTIQAYDPTQNAWIDQAPIPSAIPDVQAVSVGGLIYVPSSVLQVFTPLESTWASQQTGIATIAQDGTVTGVSPGPSTITATSTLYPATSGNTLVTVSQP